MNMNWMMAIFGGLLGVVLGISGLNIFMWQFWLIDISALLMIMIAKEVGK